uniref:Uncharacterized protein n=1 Tax=Amphimedon queenslandica TaxID=400682 RepID=A0A1X7V7P1_AMPQE
MPKVKLHYTLEGDTSVIATLSANISKMEFIFRGLPGAPENYKPTKLETADGSPITDYSLPPPDTVYVVGIKV